MTDLAPIVLFVYNRPWHTRQTLEALSRNQLADKSKLFIYADGPKENATEEQILNINEVRKLIKQKKWCEEVHIIESIKNRGLTNSIIGGITEITGKYEKVIVLEDDIIVSSGFLKYMNEALEIYEKDENVFGISGYAFPTRQKKLPETYFLHMGSSWGWGTWKRSWQKYNFNAQELVSELKVHKNFDQFDVGGYPFFDMLLEQDKEHPDTWDIQWYATIFLAEGYFLFPFMSLSRNIGFDNSGIHCREGWWSETYFSQKIKDEIRINRIEVRESLIAKDAVREFYLRMDKTPLWTRIRHKINLVFVK